MIYLDRVPVQILHGNVEQGIALVRAEDGWEGTVNITYLRADCGFAEICDEIEMKNEGAR